MPQPLTTPAFLQLLHPDDRNSEYERYRTQAYSAMGVIDSEFRIRNAKGEYVWWRMRGKVVERDALDHPLRAIGMAKDITADKEKQSQLQLAALFMQNSSDSIAVLDQDYHIIKVNKAFERMTGYSETEVLGKFPGFLSAAQDGEPRVNDIKELASRKGSWNGEGWIRRRSGENFLGRTQVNAVRDEHGNISHFVGITADVTHQRLYEDELRHLASHDTLTSLPNRTLLSDRLKQAIAACGEDDHLGVVILSLDGFSRINDTLGHDVGDEVLRETARRLSRAVDAGDTVSRVGGDTFALLLVSRTTAQTAQELVGSILQALAQPLLAGGDTLYLTASAGISLYPRDGEDPTSLIKNAEAALFRTKLHNRGAHTWYSAGMGAEAKDLLEMHTALHRAMDRDELRVHYQPKLLALTGRICGVEALVRWRDTNQRWISPGEFIPVAETYGLIDRLGEWVLATAARDILSLDQHATDFPIHLAVNLSPKQMQHADLPERIGAILAKTGFPAERLRLELTENVLMHNPAESVGLLQSLRALGIQLAVDDFGTGYSSLGYLKHFPISEIKVDKSFIHDMDDRFTLSIVKSIVALGRSLEMEVTAEGVESRGQAEVLSRLGFTQLQGFFIAEPMDIQSLAQFLVRAESVLSG
jgi:diguanylate cyclase (GGDEF)-like protein/PAS domain S-box-containing protein